MTPTTLVFVSLLSIAGCSDDAAMPADSGPGDVSVDAPVADSGPAVAEPDLPALPELTPCPEGWAVVMGVDGAPTRCDPFPAPLATPCAPGEAHFAGESGCVAIGSPCPSDGWPADLPADGPVVHVRAGAGAGGDGSRGAPFTTVLEAVAAASTTTGSIIAVAPGRYAGSLVLIDRDLSIRGACLETVLVAGPGETALTVRDTTADLRNLAIEGGRDGAYLSDASVAFSAVEFRPGDDASARGGSIRASGAEITADTLVLRGPMNDGITGFRSSIFDLRRVTIDGAQQNALSLTSVTFTATGLVVRDFGLATAGGTGIWVQADSTLTLSESAIVGGFGEALLSADRSVISIRDSVIVGLPLEASTLLGGMAAVADVDLTLSRVTIASQRGGSLVAALGSQLSATDVVVLDTQSGVDMGVGYGLEVAAAATATLERVYMDAASVVGILVDGVDSSVSATDLTVVGTRSDRGGTFGRGLQVQTGGTMTLTRGRLAGNREASAVVSRPGSRLVASDLTVEDTRARRCVEDGLDCQPAGIGIGTYEGGSAAVDTFRVTGSFLAGIQLATDGAVDLTDGIVEHNPVGANVQVPDYDIGRLTGNVAYRDNGVNLDSDALPVPAPDAVRR